MMALLPFLLALSSITGSTRTVDSLAFAPQFQLPNIFNALANNINKIAATKSTFSYTHLEGNGQLWQATNGNTKASIVIDPLASQLDFGIPWGYRANKQSISEQATIDLICDAQPSHCLLTMGLDDHTHLPTLEKLRERMPELRYIVAPSCEKKLLDFGLRADQITVLDHGESCQLSGDATATVTATQGALVGPPWQKRENGFLLELNSAKEENGGVSIYYEPHGDVVLDNIKHLRADIMVSPVTKQSLPAQVPTEGQFTLVYGGDRTLEIAESLGVEVVVPLGNGALRIEGPLAGLVSASGDVSDFEKLVEQRNIGSEDAIRVAKATPGVPLTVSV
mmetsp:Transcript_13771/g.29972  ORF Transcript_13771/g.29972 Transcript_13771/m.29972 type:complete len:337 (+) Transcript_13771:102-1112(+)|eukprot:CAMPEP_0172324398 /NCGR_PEP_ID=MMETSP1058-20130122/51293_1 /TAXON_ID=83371 /ORGANISM="Detonula confervacea, Strain CCMP 353" /LENGTH=336 /DNA_ID=CAMNT_0013040667 /DNA_START=77 /DNA_END=1087 /DNA_ORIENTATION=-